MIWRSSNDTLIASDPPCTTKENILATRQCLDNEWFPKTPPECSKAQKAFIPSCPMGHIEFQEDCEDEENKCIYGGKYCMYLSEPLPWNDTFPVRNLFNPLNNDILLYMMQNFKDVYAIWLPIRRVKPFGKFVWMYSQAKYKMFDASNLEDLINVDSIFGDCIILTNLRNETEIIGEPKIVNCNEHHRTLFVYNITDRFATKGETLTYSVTNINKAYYILDNKNKMTCKKIAEPLSVEDNYLVKTMIEDNICKIGIKKDVTNSAEYLFSWTSSGLKINYTDWDLNTNFNNSIVMISKEGWSLVEEEYIPCTVCEVDPTKYLIDLILTTNKDHSDLILTAYSNHEFNTIACSVSGLDDIELVIIPKEIEVKNIYDISHHPIQKLQNRTIWKLKIKNKNYNYYRCVGILHSGKEIRTKNVLFGKIKSGREYAFRVTIARLCKFVICDPNVNQFYVAIEAAFKKNVSSDIVRYFRALNIMSIDPHTGTIDMLFHIRTSDKLNDVFVEYNLIKKLVTNKLHGSFYNKTYLVLVDFNSIRSCLGCIPSITVDSSLHKLHWPYTNIGSNALPHVLCLQTNGLPVHRKCMGDFFHGGFWTEITGSCDSNVTYSHITTELQQIYDNRENLSVANITTHLSKLSKEKFNLLPVDIHYISQILRNVSESGNMSLSSENATGVTQGIAKTISHLISSNSSALTLSGRCLNSTNTLLDSTEKLMDVFATNSVNTTESIYQEITESYLYFTINPFLTNITGIALIKPNANEEHHTPFTEYSIQHLASNTTLSDLISFDHLEIAVYIPEELLNDIKTESTMEESRISIAFFYNDSLFVPNSGSEGETSVSGKVFSIVISGYENYLYSYIPVIIKSPFHPNETNAYCGYWEFGSVGYNNGSYPNQWRIDLTSEIELHPDKNIQICKYKHLTHFALLLGTSFNHYKPPEHEYSNINNTTTLVYSNKNEQDLILDYLTAIGCFLSILGITGIFSTAVIFKAWRERIGTRILLNVSICILFQIILLYVNYQEKGTACIIIGSLLHYIVLSGFCWSLTMAFLQYLRFVKVIGVGTPHLILKSALVGWCIPIVPVALVLIIEPSNYISNVYAASFCYPQGIVLYVTVFMPLVLIVLANLVVFCIIVHNISWKTFSGTKLRNNMNDKQMLIKQFKLAILLFSLLDLTWIFGLLAASGYCSQCLYIFCCTAPFQGFILFVFYVLLDTATWGLWSRKFLWRKKKFHGGGTGGTSSERQQRATQETHTQSSTSKDSNVFEDVDSRSRKTRTHLQEAMHEMGETHRLGAG